MAWCSLQSLILVIVVLQHHSQFSLQFDHKSKKETVSGTHGETGDNTESRLGTSGSKHSKQKADLALIIDTSGSIDNITERTLKQNLINLTRSNAIDIGKDNVRIAIITFAVQAFKALGFHEGIRPEAIINVVKRMRFGGWTNLPDGFNRAREQFINTKDRPNVPKIAILISDGHENCRPSQANKTPPCGIDYNSDCNYIAANCSRPKPPGDKCLYGEKSAVFDEFDKLKKAVGDGREGVTLAIIGVGQDINYGRDRLQCWATEKLYRELPTYEKLKETIEDLVEIVAPNNPAADCQFSFIDNETCWNNNGRCGHYLYYNITKNATSNGRECPKEAGEWRLCRFSECGLSVPIPPNGNEHEVVRPTEASDSSTGIAWWLVFVSLLLALAFILCIAILLLAFVRNRRARRAVTAGVQPSLMEPFTVNTEREISKITGLSSRSFNAFNIASKKSAGVASRNVQQSPSSVCRSAQPSSTFLDSKKDRIHPEKVRSGVVKSGSLAFVKSMSSQAIPKDSKAVHPTEGLMPISVTKS